MAEPIRVYDLGIGGVNVDKSLIQSADNETRESQNATYDNTLARAGGLTKRPGLARFNTVGLGAPVLGGIEAAYSGTAGAPSTGGGGGGVPGDPGGPASGQPHLPGTTGPGVAPGDPINAPAIGGPSGTGVDWWSTSGNSGNKLFGGKPIVVIGLGDNTSSYGSGWYITSKGFNDVGFKLLGSATGAYRPQNGFTLDRGFGPWRGTLGQTCNHDGSGSLTEGFGARPGGVLYYASYQTGTVNTAPIVNIHRNDGATDTIVATVPTNAGSQANTSSITATGCASGATSIGVSECSGFNAVALLSNYSAKLLIASGVTLAYSLTSTGTGAGTITLSTGAPFAIGAGSRLTPYHHPFVAGMSTKFGDGRFIYIAVDDHVGADVSTHFARILRFDITTQQFTEILNTSPATGSNYNATTGSFALVLSGGGLEAWAGNALQSTTGAGVMQGLVSGPGFPDGYANWIGFEGPAPTGSDATCAAIYKNGLFTGRSRNSVTPDFAVIDGNPLSGISPGTTATFTADPQLTATGGATGVSGNYFVSMAIFGGNLYTSYFNPTQAAKIYKFDGTTWSAVHTNTGASRVPFNLQVDQDGDILYAYGAKDATGTPIFMTSVDGSTWVDKSTNLVGDKSASGGSDFSNSYPMNLFADFKQ